MIKLLSDFCTHTKKKPANQKIVFIYIKYSDWSLFLVLLRTSYWERIMTIWSELSEFNSLATEYVHQRWQCFDFTEILEQQFHNCNNRYCCDFVLHTAHNYRTLSTLKNIDTHSPVQLWWSMLCVYIYIYWLQDRTFEG